MKGHYHIRPHPRSCKKSLNFIDLSFKLKIFSRIFFHSKTVDNLVLKGRVSKYYKSEMTHKTKSRQSKKSEKM